MLNVWKPWYLYRPQQLLRRAASFFDRPVSGYAPHHAAWGLAMLANPTEHLGQCLETTGIYDLAVSETIFRLVRAGNLVVDAGANLGYMTLLSAVACGPGGHVIAFEPNPDMFVVLKENIGTARARVAMAPVELHEAALGPRVERATLVLPDPAAHNTGLAFIPRNGETTAGRRSVSVLVERLDDVVGDRTVDLMKVDVEGYEFPLLQGAARAIAEQRIRHIIFEDHEGAGSAAATFLKSAGYTLFTIGWSMTKPILAEARDGRSVAASYEAPSYLATMAASEAVRACAASGWRALRRQARLRARA